MNILVIGNGFDLAHGLPTRYGDFLEFCKRVKGIYEDDGAMNIGEYAQVYIWEWDINEKIKRKLLDAFDDRIGKRVKKKDKKTGVIIATNNQALNELYIHIKNNVWIEYFFIRATSIGDNWIDFELEISRVIQNIDEARDILVRGGSYDEISKRNKELLTVFCKCKEENIEDIFFHIEKVDDFVDFINGELERLIRALEIYIVEFVGSITEISKNEDIERLKPDCVLSFNYSDTYERVYDLGKKIKYSYIHGKADINKSVKSCNLVLGIDEYLDKDKKDKKLEFIRFKKFYQRIYKSTGNLYLDWVDKIKDEYANYLKAHTLLLDIQSCSHVLYIFGHSLDVTDKDVLKMFICNDNVQTKIFYYRKDEDDKKELGKLISNLIKIMGQDELIRRTGGTHKTIEFLPQTL